MFQTLIFLVFIMCELDIKCTGTQEYHIQKRKKMHHHNFQYPMDF